MGADLYIATRAALITLPGGASVHIAEGGVFPLFRLQAWGGIPALEKAGAAFAPYSREEAPSARSKAKATPTPKPTPKGSQD